MTSYDLLIAGHVSQDVNVTPEEQESSIGGAVVYASVAARSLGANILALTKLNETDRSALKVFSEREVPFLYRNSRHTTSIRNTYSTPARDRRQCEALSVADPFSLEDFPPDIAADCYYLGGLIAGEFPPAIMGELAQRGKIATDAQGFVRVRQEGGSLAFRDWGEKREILPSVAYFKTDAAEAELLTGERNQETAARMLHDWGAEEVMVTSSPEVLVLAEGTAHAFPFTARNLSGRTGRGDTCFAAYCYWRRRHSPKESCLFAAALTSLKMETPGHFAGTDDDVRSAIARRYSV